MTTEKPCEYLYDGEAYHELVPAPIGSRPPAGYVRIIDWPQQYAFSGTCELGGDPSDVYGPEYADEYSAGSLEEAVEEALCSHEGGGFKIFEGMTNWPPEPVEVEQVSHYLAEVIYDKLREDFLADDDAPEGVAAVTKACQDAFELALKYNPSRRLNGGCRILVPMATLAAQEDGEPAVEWRDL